MTNQKAMEYLGDAGLEGEIQEVDAGNVSQTYQVGEDYFLQFTENAPDNLRRGILGLESQQETDVPVPEIVYSDLEEPVLVTETVEGESLGTTSEEEVYRNAGQLMADIHEQKFDSYGLMTVFEGELMPSGSEDWRNSFSTLYHRFMGSVSELLDQGKAAQIDRFYYDNIPDLVEDPEKSLAHFDFHGDNLLHQEGEITGVLDWDMTRVLDPALEVIKTQHQFQREGKPVEAFTQGYQNQRNLDMNPETEDLYRLTAELGRLSEIRYLQQTQDITPENYDLEETVENIDEIIEPV